MVAAIGVDGHAQFRDEVREFLRTSLPEDFGGIGAMAPAEVEAFTVEWRAALRQQRYLAVHWPTQYGGGGRSAHEAVILAEELTRAGVPLGSPNDGFSIRLLGNTILHWGRPDQKAHNLPRILAGDDVWCQGFSEPGAGSDLAGLGTRAELDGDEWIINGHKTWTSEAHRANRIFVLCRTNPSAPKHRGVSLLLVDLRQPGVDIQPIAMMTGARDFNEVFFTDVRAPRADVIGGVDNGWAVSMTLLGYERGENTATEVIRFEAELTRLFDLARDYGRLHDPIIRQRLALAWSKVKIMSFLGDQVLATWLAGEELGPAASIGKVFWSEHHQEISELAMDIMGPAGLVPVGQPPGVFGPDDASAPNSTGSWAGLFLNARAGTIYAGSNEIQRNVIAEKILGLPKEPRPDPAR